ncbi:FAD-dependent monooxygenase [Symbioplanes lichenis]|uniref:FAD-dependent monooxygenase n=1 Tax=Symbioplanes lichenis TaxID=1629072 RepID=UPI0027391D6A|nr:FAD-dependent monooxygenase [Actinoplanes lichenis]
MTGVRTAIVIGAGPAGLATAVALGKAGIQATVYERGAALSAAGGGLTLWPNGLTALASFGAAEDVRAVALASPGTAMRTAAGRLLSATTGPELDRIGGQGLALHRADLLAALAGRLGPGAVRFGRRCAGVRSGAHDATVVFEDGGEDRADVVIAADGIRSRLRADVDPRPLRYAGFAVWRATVHHPLPAAPGLLTFGGAHQFGIWRLPGDRVYWFASAPVADPARAPVRPPELFHTWHDPIPELLDVTTPAELTLTGAYDCPPLRAWHAGRVVLAGDAAHPALPTMGQGASQAFEDAAVLAAELGSGTELDTALHRYHRRRRRRARAAWSQARMLARVGAWRHPLACRLRDTMIASAPAGAQRRQLQRLFTTAGEEARS